MTGYRTLILVALTEVFSLWQATAPSDVIPQRWVPFVTGLFGIGFGILRIMTTGPVGVDPNPAPGLVDQGDAAAWGSYAPTVAGRNPAKTVPSFAIGDDGEPL